MLISRIPIVDLKERYTIQNELLGISIPRDMLKSREVIQTLLKVDFPFFLCLDFSPNQEKISKNEINNLISVTFNVNYYKEFNVPLLLFSGKELINKSTKEEIQTSFLTQGYQQIKTHQLIEGDNSLSGLSDSFFITNLEIKREWADFYNSLSVEVIQHKLFVKIPFFQVNRLFEQIEEAEQKFAKSNLKLSESFIKIKRLKYENDLLKSRNESTSKQVANSKINQKLLKEDAANVITWYKNEVEKIKGWYHKEYEVLPSWFKKLGHLIKRLK
jgi:hypothetical protein